MKPDRVDIIFVRGVEHEVPPIDTAIGEHELLALVNRHDEIELPDGSLYAVLNRRWRFTHDGTILVLYVSVRREASTPAAEAAA